jgi:hypothetical protein
MKRLAGDLSLGRMQNPIGALGLQLVGRLLLEAHRTPKAAQP